LHYYTGSEIVLISNYLYELERRDSIRISNVTKLAPIIEYHLEEEEDLRNFESIVFFKLGSADLSIESYEPLEGISDILKTYLNLKFEIVGYTDNSGSQEANKALSLKRAIVVKNYLISKGVSPDRLTRVLGVGGDEYVASNNSKTDKAKNRNVIIRAYH
jgi:outer membrane protein OmpA-like peptidoglycan-associated protein